MTIRVCQYISHASQLQKHAQMIVHMMLVRARAIAPP